MRALIVDDEAGVCVLLRGLLTRDFGCAATEASSGLEALDLLSRGSFDFMLLDLVLPGVDGIDVLRAVRANPQLAAMPVGVMSTVRDEARVREAIGLGIGSYLTKPLDRSEIGGRLARFIATAGLLRATARRSCAGLRPGAHILVVDGNRDFLQRARMALTPPYAVTLAHSGPDGFLRCLERAPDIVLVGENLGVLPTQVFVDMLRSLPRLATTPVVAIVKPGDTAMAAGVDATLTRTLDSEMLRRQFVHVVGHESRLAG